MKARSEQLYEIDQMLFDQSEPGLSSLYKTKKVKKSTIKRMATVIGDVESTESPSPNNKKGRMNGNKFNPRAFLNSVFPGDDDSKTFDKMERIQKLMIVDTTPDVMQSWGIIPSHFKNLSQSSIKSSLESSELKQGEFVPYFNSIVVSTN